jgi:hypothetical protein
MTPLLVRLLGFNYPYYKFCASSQYLSVSNPAEPSHLVLYMYMAPCSNATNQMFINFILHVYFRIQVFGLHVTLS